eukprot:sb/3474715/
MNIFIRFHGLERTRQSGVNRPNWEHFCPQVSRITCLTGGNLPPAMCYTDSVIGAECHGLVKRGASSADVIIVGDHTPRSTTLSTTASHVTLSTISDTMITSADEAPPFTTLSTNYRICVTHGWRLISPSKTGDT